MYTFNVVHVLYTIDIKEKSDKKCNTQSGVMGMGHIYFQPLFGDGSPKFVPLPGGLLMSF